MASIEKNETKYTFRTNEAVREALEALRNSNLNVSAVLRNMIINLHRSLEREQQTKKKGQPTKT